MAVSSFKYLKTPYHHSRSISLPSRSNPLTLPVEEQLYKLRSSSLFDQVSSTSSQVNSLVLLCDDMSGLNDLYDCVDDLFQSPITYRALTQERSDRCVNDVLDGSVALLDTCSTTRDVLLQMKECIQDLQSCLRRKSRRGMCFRLLENEAERYMNSRKKVTKAIQKCLRDLKRMENRRAFPILLEKDQNLIAIIGVLREVEWITLSTFEALFSTLLSGSKARSSSKPPALRGWSLVSKLMHLKCGVTNNKEEEEDHMCEVEKLDVELNTLIISCKYNSMEVVVQNVQHVQKMLEEMEFSIKELEDRLELVFKSLIKTRVSLLNILSN